MKKSNILQNFTFSISALIEKICDSVIPRKRFIESAQIEVSSFCMGKCSYCPQTILSKSWKKRHLRIAAMSRLDSLLQHTKRVHLQGWGEPFLHPYFFDLVSYAEKAGCDVSTTTSGLIINEKIVNRLINSSIDIMAISFCGSDEYANSCRKNVNFHTVCNNIKFLTQRIRQIGHGPKVHLAYLMLADRMEQAVKLPELMNKLDADAAVVSTLDYILSQDHKCLAIMPQEREKITKAQEILRYASELAKADGKTIYYSLPGDKLAPCGCRENIKSTLYIDAEGKISPCVYLNPPVKNMTEKVIFGDAMLEDVLKIWHKPEYIEFRNGLSKGEAKGACANCPKRFEIFQL